MEEFLVKIPSYEEVRVQADSEFDAFAKAVKKLRITGYPLRFLWKYSGKSIKRVNPKSLGGRKPGHGLW